MSSRITTVELATRPAASLKAADFRIGAAAMPSPGEGEVLVRTLWLSIDPYLLRVISGVPGYVPAIGPGDVMFGRAISQVVESRDARFKPGDCVHLYSRWQTHFVAKASDLRMVDARRFPGSAYLGALGQSGLTAWAGLLIAAKFAAGETVVVSSAAGIVGSIVGQIARIKGGRAVGIAGGPEKCARVVGDFGFDACVDYKSPQFEAELKAALPDGANLNFENVGGAVFDAVLPNMKKHGRTLLCGLLAHYGGEPLVFRNSAWLLNNTQSIQAFSVFEHLSYLEQSTAEIGAWIEQGKLKYHESVAHGIESAAQAMVDMFSGRTLGKQVVKVAEPD